MVFFAMPFNLNPFFKLLYSLLPYREATLHLPFSVLPLKMRLPTLSIVFLLLLGLGWLAFFVTEKLPLEIIPFFLIILLFSYALFVYIFRYTAERTLKILESTILLNNSAE
jgi:hypothetical protein